LHLIDFLAQYLAVVCLLEAKHEDLDCTELPVQLAQELWRFLKN